MLLRYEYFCTYTLILYSRIMGCHGNHEISKTKEHLFLRTIFFLHLGGRIGQIYAHNDMSYVFNLGLITLKHTIVYPWFLVLIFKISLIFMNMQMR